MSRLSNTLMGLVLTLTVSLMPLREAQAQASPDIVGTNTMAIMGATVSGFPSCVNWKVTGVCFFLHCTPFGCEVKTSIKISHYIPDAIVSTYADPANHPWTDFGKPVASALSKVGSGFMKSALDSSAQTARETKEIASFKASDSVGHPLSNLIAMANGSGGAMVPDKIPLPTAEELMRFPAQGLGEVATLWASVPVNIANTMVEDARRLAANPSSLLSGITGIGSTFTNAMNSNNMGGGMDGGGLGGGGGSPTGGGGGAGGGGGFDAESLAGTVRGSGGGEGGDYFCIGATKAFNVYFHSDLDSWFWRSFLPLDLLYPQSWIPGYGEVGNMLLNTWGNVFPRSGELVQSHPAKGSATLATRVFAITSRRYQPHIYKPMLLPKEAEDYVYFAKLADPKWQPVFPIPEPSCINFGTPDLIGPFAARDFKTSSTDGYIWNLWTRYECCKKRPGVFLFSVP